MIEAKGTRIYSDGKLLCTVELVGEIYESGPAPGFQAVPDYDAQTSARERAISPACATTSRVRKGQSARTPTDRRSKSVAHNFTMVCHPPEPGARANAKCN